MFLYLKIIFFRKELKKNLDFLNYSHFLKKFSSEMKISNERCFPLQKKFWFFDIFCNFFFIYHFYFSILYLLLPNYFIFKENFQESFNKSIRIKSLHLFSSFSHHFYSFFPIKKNHKSFKTIFYYSFIPSTNSTELT